MLLFLLLESRYAFNFPIAFIYTNYNSGMHMVLTQIWSRTQRNRHCFHILFHTFMSLSDSCIHSLSWSIRLSQVVPDPDWNQSSNSATIDM